MPFSNPIVGITTLIRDAIRSRNFTSGSQGWSINADGSAEFSDLSLFFDGTFGRVVIENGEIIVYNVDDVAVIRIRENGLNGTPEILVAHPTSDSWIRIYSDDTNEAATIDWRPPTIASDPTRTKISGGMFTRIIEDPAGQYRWGMNIDSPAEDGFRQATLTLNGASSDRDLTSFNTFNCDEVNLLSNGALNIEGIVTVSALAGGSNEINGATDFIDDVLFSSGIQVTDHADFFTSLTCAPMTPVQVDDAPTATTGSTAYTSLFGTSPRIIVPQPASGFLKVTVSAEMWNSTAGAAVWSSFSARENTDGTTGGVGTTFLGSADNNAALSRAVGTTQGQETQQTTIVDCMSNSEPFVDVLMTGRVGTGTGSFRERRLIVEPCL